jgi:hypothetical protein
MKKLPFILNLVVIFSCQKTVNTLETRIIENEEDVVQIIYQKIKTNEKLKANTFF